MRMVVPFPSESPAVPGPTPGAVSAKLGQATLVVSPIGPLPFDLLSWRDAVIQAGVTDAKVQLISQEQAETVATGWPVNLFVTDVIKGAEVVERRLHAFYILVERAAIAVLSGSPAAVDAAIPAARDLILRAVPDFTLPEVASLAQLWEGFGPVSAS